MRRTVAVLALAACIASSSGCFTFIGRGIGASSDEAHNNRPTVRAGREPTTNRALLGTVVGAVLDASLIALAAYWLEDPYKTGM